jgi:hypothetical protein
MNTPAQPSMSSFGFHQPPAVSQQPPQVSPQPTSTPSPTQSDDQTDPIENDFEDEFDIPAFLRQK